MIKITFKDAFNILFIGIVASMLMYLIVQVLFARIIDSFIDSYSGEFVLFLIVIGSMCIMLIISVLVSLIVIQKISSDSLYKASIFALLSTFFIIWIISSGYIVFNRPPGSEDYNVGQIIINIPYNIVYYSVFGLTHPFYFSILVSGIYFSIYIVFLERYYKFKSIKYVRSYEKYKW